VEERTAEVDVVKDDAAWIGKSSKSKDGTGLASHRGGELRTSELCALKKLRGAPLRRLEKYGLDKVCLLDEPRYCEGWFAGESRFVEICGYGESCAKEQNVAVELSLAEVTILNERGSEEKAGSVEDCLAEFSDAGKGGRGERGALLKSRLAKDCALGKGRSSEQRIPSKGGAAEVGLLSEGRFDELAECVKGAAMQVNAWKDESLEMGWALSRICKGDFELSPELVEEGTALLIGIVGVHQANGNGVNTRRRVVKLAAACGTRVKVIHPDGA
jgi:hypothetical protein